MSEIVINSVLPDQFYEIRNVEPSPLAPVAPVAAAADRVADALKRADATRQSKQKRDGGFSLPKGDR